MGRGEVGGRGSGAARAGPGAVLRGLHALSVPPRTTGECPRPGMRERAALCLGAARSGAVLRLDGLRGLELLVELVHGGRDQAPYVPAVGRAARGGVDAERVRLDQPAREADQEIDQVPRVAAAAGHDGSIPVMGSQGSTSTPAMVSAPCRAPAIAAAQVSSGAPVRYETVSPSASSWIITWKRGCRGCRGPPGPLIHEPVSGRTAWAASGWPHFMHLSRGGSPA